MPLALRRVLAVAGVAIVALSLQSCGGDEIVPSTSTSVKADKGSGFTYQAPDGVTVTGTSGVAPPDTEVSITTASRPQNGLPRTLSYLGVSVEIVIGAGEQPTAPITVSVPIPPDINGDTNGVIAYTVHEGVPEFLPVTVTDGLLHTTMTKLSWVDFFKIDFSSIAGAIGDSIKKLLTGESSGPPDCLGQPVTLHGVAYNAERTKTPSGNNLDAAWPCLEINNGAIELTLTANGNRAWLVRSAPDVGSGALSAPNAGHAAASGLFKTFFAMGNRSTGTLMPGTSLTLPFSSANPPQRAEVRVDAGLMLTSALVYEISAIYDFTGMSTFDNLDKVPGAWDCLNGVASTFTSRDGNFVDNFASAYTAVLDCMSAVAPGPLAFLLNVLGGGVQIVSGLLTGAWSEITQGNHGVIVISRSGQPDTSQGAQDYVQQWTGHSRQMTVNDDGSADITLFSGAMNGEQWQARWSTTADGIEVTLTSRLSTTGDGLGDLSEGTTWIAALQRAEDGTTVLHFVDVGEDLSDSDSGFYWCSDGYGYSSVCGA